MSERRERLCAQHFPEPRHEEGGILGEGEHADPAGVLKVGVEDGIDLAVLESAREELGLRAAAEGLKLHEETAVGALPAGAALGDVYLDLRSPGMRRATHTRRLPSAGVHLEVRLGLELGDLDKGLPVREQEPILRAPVLPGCPGGADKRHNLCF